MLSIYVRQDTTSTALVIPKLPVSKARGGLQAGVDLSSNRSLYDAMDAGVDLHKLS
jgi:hypothetical protein